MKKVLIIITGALALGAASPAIAGRDSQAIEQWGKVAKAHATTEKGCESRRLVLPLDHGPRATSTPYLNQQRRERFQAEMEACKEPASKQ